MVVDCVGSYSGAGCRALLARGGRHVIVSGDSIGAVAQLLVPPFSSKAVLGRPRRERLARVVAAVAAGQLKLNIAGRFGLAEAEQAHHAQPDRARDGEARAASLGSTSGRADSRSYTSSPMARISASALLRVTTPGRMR